MLARGVYLAPSAYEAGFVSAAHGETEIAHTLQAAREAFQLVAKSGATLDGSGFVVVNPFASAVVESLTSRP